MNHVSTTCCLLAGLAIAASATTATAAQPSRAKPTDATTSMARQAPTKATTASRPTGTTTTRTDAATVKAPLSIEQRLALGDAMAKKQRGFRAPATEAQAKPTYQRQSNGVESMQVPSSLWSHLAVQKDAQGNLHQVEPATDQAPTTLWEGLDNE